MIGSGQYLGRGKYHLQLGGSVQVTHTVMALHCTIAHTLV